MNPPNKADTAGKIILWTIWISLMTALPFYKIFLGAGDRTDTHARPVDVVVLGLFLVPLLMSVAIRWLIIPAMKSYTAILPLFIAGVAVAESLVFYGKFLVPEFDTIFFFAAVLAMAQFVPVFKIRKEYS